MSAVRRGARLQVESLEDRRLLAFITEYPIPSGKTSLGNGLFGITGGPDGNVYFTDTQDTAIGQVTPSGAITELPVSSGGGGFFGNGLDGITLGPSNALAFTESSQGVIGEMTTTGSYTRVPIASGGEGPDRITTAADGTLWWTEDAADSIGEMTPSGVIHQYSVPGATSGGIIGPSMKGITVGSDGNVWFTNWGPLGDFIGKMTPTGSVTEYPLSFGTDPVGIVAGPDGNLWFTAYGSNSIDVMSTSGAMLHQYGVSGGDLADITVGADGNLYFTEQTGDIGEITTGGTVTITPVSTTVNTVPGASGPQPLAITSGPDGNIWFTDPWTDSIGVLRISTSGAPTLTAISTSTVTAAVGQSVTFTATVSDLSPGGATPNGGTVTFSDQGGTIGTASLVNGVATLTTASLAAGTDTVGASYDGTTAFAPSTTGTIVTAAGNGVAGYSGDGGPATAAAVLQPGGLAVDSAGDLFITEGYNDVVREVVAATGEITTVAGDGANGYSGDGGPATQAELMGPNSVAVDSAGDLFISDTQNERIREVVKSTGDIITIAGDGAAGDTGDGGPAIDAEIDNPLGLCVDSAGDVFFADPIYDVIREVVKSTGDIITVAGDGTAGYSGDNGPATAAELNNPADVAVDPAGDLFISDTNNNRIREVVKSTGDIVTVAGDGTAGYSGDGGPAAASELHTPSKIALDPTGDLFIADVNNFVIREVVKATGDIVTVAGDGTAGYSGDGGPATAAELNRAARVAVDSAGDLFTSDSYNNRVRQVTPAAIVAVIQTGQAPTSTFATDVSTAFSPDDQSVVLSATVTSTAGLVDEGSVTFTILSGTTTIGSPVSADVVEGTAGVSYDLPAGTPPGIYTIEAVYGATTDFLGSSDATHSLTATSPPPTKWVIQTGPPATATAGVPFATAAHPIVIEEEDQYGDVETGDNSTVVSVALGSGSGPLLGTFTAQVVGGVATFDDLADDTVETIAVTFTAGDLTPVTSSSIDIEPPTGVELILTQQPSPVGVAGQVFATQPIVEEVDQYGNIIADAAGTVTAARGDTGTATLPGNILTVTLVDGVATFAGLSYDKAEPMDLTFTSSVSGIAPATSNQVIVVPTVASQLVIAQQPSSTATVGQPFDTQPVVDEEDEFGNIESGDSTSQVTAMLASGAGPLRGLPSVTLVDGVGRFSGLVDDRAETTTLEFSDGTLLSATSSPIVVGSAAAVKLVVTTPPPGSLLAGQPFGMVVTAEDAFGNVATSFDGAVTAALAGEPGGAATVQSQAGVATFTGLTVDSAAQGESIEISGSGLTGTASAPLNVSANGNASGNGNGGSPPVTPAIAGESVSMSRKTDKKGKPVGKATLSGFTLQFSTAMNAATAASSANYAIAAATIKRIKKKKETVLKPVAFSASYNAATNAVTLTLAGKQTFAQGGQITVVYGPGGVESDQNVPLSSSDAQFTIQPKATGIAPG